ncbi:DUF2065 domain-containing protein [Thalassotalea atypica]|uniref:DUF2065 domain-containing protein n=1 Tax=Thalassotalea atypica TaxID=2054316 RepID=UPI0025728D65|nr:DUF2065 domain-containing protein [Thalassotalea atypica]
MTKIILMAIAVAFILEGLAPALFPNKWRAYVAKLAQEPVANIRMIGIVIMLMGLAMLWWFSEL